MHRSWAVERKLTGFLTEKITTRRHRYQAELEVGLRVSGCITLVRVYMVRSANQYLARNETESWHRSFMLKIELVPRCYRRRYFLPELR
jgi:hypothetical protein